MEIERVFGCVFVNFKVNDHTQLTTQEKPVVSALDTKLSTFPNPRLAEFAATIIPEIQKCRDLAPKGDVP